MEKKRIYLMIPDQTGDTRMMLEWDPNDPESVKEMKARFLEYRKKGYLFYECKGFLGKYKPKGKPVKEFDKSVKRLLGEKHFDDLKETLTEVSPSSKVTEQEVILTETVKHTEEMEIVHPENEELKDGATYGVAPVVSGG